jgi:hypothetical protein
MPPARHPQLRGHPCTGSSEGVNPGQTRDVYNVTDQREKLKPRGLRRWPVVCAERRDVRGVRVARDSEVVVGVRSGRLAPGAAWNLLSTRRQRRTAMSDLWGRAAR